MLSTTLLHHHRHQVRHLPITAITTTTLTRRHAFSSSSSASPHHHHYYHDHNPKHACVVGAGLQGVTTAYALAKQGLKVTLLEQGPAPACYASHSNCGMVCPILSTPLNSLSTARKGVTSALKTVAGIDIDRRHSNDVIVSPTQLKDKHFVAWGLLFLAHCQEATRAKAAVDMYRLAEWSSWRTEEVIKEMNMEEDVGLRREGALKVWGASAAAGNNKQAQAALKDATALLFSNKDNNSKSSSSSSSSFLSSSAPVYRVPDAEGCMTLEPALSHTHTDTLAGGGVFYEGVATGDARAFTQGLARRMVERKDMDVTLETGVEVLGVDKEGGKATAVYTNTHERLEADLFVLACGALSNRFMSSSGSPFSIPIIPMKGYSLSLPIPPRFRSSVSACVNDGIVAPSRCLILEDHHVYISRLGNTLRVGGLAEFVGVNTEVHTHTHTQAAPLYKLMDAVTAAFPALAKEAGWLEMSWEERGAWGGLRPTTPDSLPILSALATSRNEGGGGGGGGGGENGGCVWGENVYVNGGHGTMGWTLAMGSADVLGAVALGRPEMSPVDPTPFALERFEWGRILRRLKEGKGGKGVEGKEEGEERRVVKM